MGGSAGNVLKSTAKSLANTATLGVYGAATTNKGNFLENAAGSFAGGVTGFDTAKVGVQETGKILADITGATAANANLAQQAEQARQEARRQAILSDALARNEGDTTTRVSLNTGRNRRSLVQNSTGVSGASSSKGTGVQS